MAFNLKQIKNSHINQDSNHFILIYELSQYGLDMIDDKYCLNIGDEHIVCSSLNECCQHVQKAIIELKKIQFNNWEKLYKLCSDLISNQSINISNLDNILFISNVKKAYSLSEIFPELNKITETIKKIFNVSIANISHEYVIEFNSIFLQIQLIHFLIMQEIYKTRLISELQKNNKIAQISGPWANADLPMQERVWDWSEDEEHFDNRTRARKQQIRYNPEVLPKTGFAAVWQENRNNPYSFYDSKDESPYYHGYQLTIA